jgi:transketolase
MNYSCPTTIVGERLKIAVNTGLLITYEDHHIDTGLASTISLYLAEKNYNGRFLRFGVKFYGASGTPDELFKTQGIDPETLAEKIKEAK